MWQDIQNENKAISCSIFNWILYFMGMLLTGSYSLIIQIPTMTKRAKEY